MTATIHRLAKKPKLRVIEGSGPSPDFIHLTRNPNLEAPTRFEPTVKGEDDVVISTWRTQR